MLYMIQNSQNLKLCTDLVFRAVALVLLYPTNLFMSAKGIFVKWADSSCQFS